MPNAAYQSDAQAVYSGTLLHNAEARSKVIDAAGHVVPVLVLEIITDTSLGLPVHIEQPFPADHMHQCQAAAKRHRKGDRITVQAPVHSHRLAIVASHIHTNPTH